MGVTGSLARLGQEWEQVVLQLWGVFKGSGKDSHAPAQWLMLIQEKTANCGVGQSPNQLGNFFSCSLKFSVGPVSGGAQQST